MTRDRTNEPHRHRPAPVGDDQQDLLEAFQEVGALEWPDVHTARRLGALAGETRPEAQLALALTVWAARAGSVCVDLSTIASETFIRDEQRVDTAALAWPDPTGWLATLSESPLVGVEPDGPRRPLRLQETRLYLDRYWRDEELVRTALRRRADQVAPIVDEATLDAASLRLFPDRTPSGQYAACRTAATSWTTVIAGGPGTGKTTTIGRLLLALQGLGPQRIALAAPTGKAAVRLSEAVRAEFMAHGAEALTDGIHARTVHKLLGLRPGGGPRRSADPLPYDVIVVDEMSMVSLPLMAQLLAATPPTTRLVLVGDPDQLASVEAGAVLADLTEAGTTARLDIVRLTENFRFGTRIGAVAEAIRMGDPEATLAALRAGDDTVRLLETDLHEPPSRLQTISVDTSVRMREAAARGDIPSALAALSDHRILCGHRVGRHGVAVWNRLAQQWSAEASPLASGDGEWYPGRPILITENAPELGLFNGDTGVVVASGSGLRVAFSDDRVVPTHVVDAAVTAHAMTIHKAQGSQFGEVSLIVPPPGSPLLTRQLLYTAVTRARSRLTVYGEPQAIADAVAHPALRASGLRSGL